MTAPLNSQARMPPSLRRYINETGVARATGGRRPAPPDVVQLWHEVLYGADAAVETFELDLSKRFCFVRFTRTIAGAAVVHEVANFFTMLIGRVYSTSHECVATDHGVWFPAPDHRWAVTSITAGSVHTPWPSVATFCMAAAQLVVGDGAVTAVNAGNHRQSRHEARKNVSVDNLVRRWTDLDTARRAR